MAGLFLLEVCPGLLIELLEAAQLRYQPVLVVPHFSVKAYEPPVDII